MTTPWCTIRYGFNHPLHVNSDNALPKSRFLSLLNRRGRTFEPNLVVMFNDLQFIIRPAVNSPRAVTVPINQTVVFVDMPLLIVGSKN